MRKLVKLLYTGVFVLVTCDLVSQSVPQLVAHGTISTGRDYCTTLTPDGNRMYFAREGTDGLDEIMYADWNGSKWSTPSKVNFTGKFSDTDPLLSPDGQTLYFMTNRNPSESGWMDDYDIWAVDRGEDDWGKPYRLPDFINTSFNEGFPNITSSGNLYFFRSNKNGHTEQDIWISKWTGGGFDFPQKIGGGISTKKWDGHPFVNAAEEFMIFYSSNREDGFGSCDLYISLKNDREWSQPQNLGAKINSEACEMVPFVSRDNQTLYFTRSQNGERNIYSIDFDLVLKDLKLSLK